MIPCQIRSNTRIYHDGTTSSSAQEVSMGTIKVGYFQKESPHSITAVPNTPSFPDKKVIKRHHQIPPKLQVTFECQNSKPINHSNQKFLTFQKSEIPKRVRPDQMHSALRDFRRKGFIFNFIVDFRLYPLLSDHLN